MSWETIKDYTFLILGVLFATIELIRSFRKRKLKAIIVLLLISIILFIGLGIDQINRNNRDKETSRKLAEVLNNKVGNLQQAKSRDSINRITDSVKDAEFQKKLFVEFKIIRDSALNKPVQSNYNSKIEKAENVHIGPN